tara:strand:- start:548 stop:679 length:132 start_codon:yes stop_codon:yes gene_type:complete
MEAIPFSEGGSNQENCDINAFVYITASQKIRVGIRPNIDDQTF